MGGEAVDEQYLLAGLGMGAHHGMLGIRVLGLECQALLSRHGCTERGFDAVPRTQASDLDLDLVGQLLVGQSHVDPHGVAAHRRAFHAAQHAAHWR